MTPQISSLTQLTHLMFYRIIMGLQVFRGSAGLKSPRCLTHMMQLVMTAWRRGWAWQRHWITRCLSLSLQVVSGSLPLHAPTICFLQHVSWASNIATQGSQEDKGRGFQCCWRLSPKPSQWNFCYIPCTDSTLMGTSIGTQILKDIRDQVQRVTTMRVENDFMFIDLRPERLLPAFTW